MIRLFDKNCKSKTRIKQKTDKQSKTRVKQIKNMYEQPTKCGIKVQYSRFMISNIQLEINRAFNN